MRLLTVILCILLVQSPAQAQFPVLPGVLNAPVSASSTCGLPAFSPPAGTYSSTQSVAITSSGSCTVCYNTIGSIIIVTPGTCPAGTTTYSTPVSVVSSETLYAVGTKSGYTSSSQASAAYTITAGTQSIIGGTRCYGASASCVYTPTSTSNLLVACSAIDNNPETINTPSATGYTFTAVTALQGAGTFQQRCWTAPIPSTSSATFTFTSQFGSGNFAGVFEVHGVTATIDTSSYSTGSNSAITSGSFTTAGASDIVIGYGVDAGGNAPSGTGSWVNIPFATCSCVADNYVAGVYQANLAAGTYNPSASSTTNSWTIQGFGIE